MAAAPWVPVDEVRVLIDGEVARTFRGLPAGGEITRLDQRLELTVRRDAFVTVEAGVPLRTDPERWRAAHPGPYADVAPGFVPQAIGNPVFLDADGDGRFTGPGLGFAPERQAGDDSLLLVGSVVAVLATVWFWLRRRTGLAPRRR